MTRASTAKTLVDKLLPRLVNTLSVLYSYFYFPTYSNGLKDIGNYLGCSWTERDASGIESMVWRNRWESTSDDKWKKTLLTYNLEDCAILKKVTDLIYTIAANTGSGHGPLALGNGTLPVSLVQDVDKLTQNRTWGRVAFYHADYAYITHCAYFNYQRDRVYIRTSRTLRKSMAQLARKQNRRLRINQCVQILVSTCPFCNSNEIATALVGEVLKYRRPRVKRAFDLVFTSSGMRRTVYECRTLVHRCLKCNQEFIPEQYQRLDKHWHGPKSWTIYQHVAQRLTLGPIQSMVQEFFGLTVSHSERHMFKQLMARYYEKTYNTLLAKILAGNLLNLDETEVKLHIGKGYV
jgi:RNase_H superfamily